MARRRKANISEPLQPAPKVEVEDLHGFPRTTFIRSGGLLHFHGMAPITGDGLYRGYNNKGELKHAIVVNPSAAEHQLAYFHRKER